MQAEDMFPGASGGDGVENVEQDNDGCKTGEVRSSDGSKCLKCPKKCASQCVSIPHDSEDVVACPCGENESHDPEGNCKKCPSQCGHGCSFMEGTQVWCHCAEGETNDLSGKCVKCPKGMCKTNRCYINHDTTATNKFICDCNEGEAPGADGKCQKCPAKCLQTGSGDGCYVDDLTKQMMCNCKITQTQSEDGRCIDCPSNCAEGCWNVNPPGMEPKYECHCQVLETKGRDGQCVACPAGCKQGCHYDIGEDIFRCNCRTGKTSGKDGLCTDCPDYCDSNGCMYDSFANRFLCACGQLTAFDEKQRKCVRCPTYCNTGCEIQNGSPVCSCNENETPGKGGGCVKCPAKCKNQGCQYDQEDDAFHCYDEEDGNGGGEGNDGPFAMGSSSAKSN